MKAHPSSQWSLGRRPDEVPDAIPTTAETPSRKLQRFCVQFIGNPWNSGKPPPNQSSIAPPNRKVWSMPVPACLSFAGYFSYFFRIFSFTMCIVLYLFLSLSISPRLFLCIPLSISGSTRFPSLWKPVTLPMLQNPVSQSLSLSLSLLLLADSPTSWWNSNAPQKSGRNDHEPVQNYNFEKWESERRGLLNARFHEKNNIKIFNCKVFLHQSFLFFGFLSSFLFEIPFSCLCFLLIKKGKGQNKKKMKQYA